MKSLTISDKRVKLLEELEQLLSLTRKEKGKSLLSFIDAYLKHQAPVQRPQFHKDIFNLLEQQTDSNSKKVREGSVSPPTPVYNNIIPGTDISPKNRELTYKATDNYNRLLFIAPRGFSKSTICSRFFPLWLACYGHKKDIFLVSATVSLAKENLRMIRNELEGNERIIKDFGELKSDKWTEEQLVLTNGTIIRAKGQGFQIRGFRPDLIVCDDLESDDIVASKEQREKLENWFFRTLIPTLKPDQGLVYIGTKLHQFALIAKLEEKPEFISNTYRALTDGKSIWEQMWPTARLIELKREIGTYAFESEYQNNPLSLKEQPIKPHYLDGVKATGDRLVRCMAIDPAISEKESADYRAISIFDRTEDDYFKEVITEKGRWGIDEQVEKILDMYVRYNPERVLIEEVAFQKVMSHLITKRARERGIYIPITRAELGVGKNKRPKDKMTRLLQIIHLFEQKFVEVVNPDLREELLSFPFGEYDDQVDACVYSLYWLMKYRTGQAMRKKDIPITLGAKESFYVEEVRPGVFYTKKGTMKELIPRPEKRTNFINFDKP